jgi:hypothetical protein
MINNKPSTLRYAAIGAAVSLLLAAAGQRMDSAIPAIPLDQQVFYNWLTVLLSPASFLMRLRDPDGAVVPSVSFVVVAALFNAFWYAFVSRSCRGLRQALRLPGPISASAVQGATQPSIAELHTSAAFASRRTSPSERLADRYEHRLSSEHASSSGLESESDAELPVTATRQ